MKRLFKLQADLLREIDKYEKIVPDSERDYPCDWERIHVVSCAKIGLMMAQERGVDPVLAAAACSCHDFGRIINGKQEDHAEFGFVPVQKFLKKTGIFEEKEIEQIAIAVRNHSRKDVVGEPLEEIVKDADVLDFYQYGYDMYKKSQTDRLEKLLEKN